MISVIELMLCIIDRKRNGLKARESFIFSALYFQSFPGFFFAQKSFAGAALVCPEKYCSCNMMLEAESLGIGSYRRKKYSQLKQKQKDKIADGWVISGRPPDRADGINAG